MTEKITTRIQKLLALAGNNPSREEAESAMLAAQSLLAKHGLAMADIQSQPEEVQESALDGLGKRPVWWQRFIAGVIAENFRCLMLVDCTRSGSRVVLVGLETDVEVATYVATLAIRTASRLAKEFLATEKRTRTLWSRRLSTRLRNDFLRGYIQGLAESFREQVASSGTELVLVCPREVEEYVDEQATTKVIRSRIVSADSDAAHEEGRRSGAGFTYQEGLGEGA